MLQVNTSSPSLCPTPFYSVSRSARTLLMECCRDGQCNPIGDDIGCCRITLPAQHSKTDPQGARALSTPGEGASLWEQLASTDGQIPASVEEAPFSSFETSNTITSAFPASDIAEQPQYLGFQVPYVTEQGPSTEGTMASAGWGATLYGVDQSGDS